MTRNRGQGFTVSMSLLKYVVYMIQHEIEAYLLVEAVSPPDRRGRRSAPWCPVVRGQGFAACMSLLKYVIQIQNEVLAYLLVEGGSLQIIGVDVVLHGVQGSGDKGLLSV